MSKELLAGARRERLPRKVVVATDQAEKGFARQPGQVRRIVEKIVGRIHNFSLELIKRVDALRPTSLSGHFDMPGAYSVTLLNACRTTLIATLENQHDELLRTFKEIGYERFFGLQIDTALPAGRAAFMTCW